MPLNQYDKTNYWGPTITEIITTDWVCVKTDVSRMFHEGDKGGWFTYMLWQEHIYIKNVIAIL